MGKTTDLFKKIRDTKGTFHAKMGSIKDRYGMDLTEAEDIKKRWQEYTEELYKKDFHVSCFLTSLTSLLKCQPYNENFSRITSPPYPSPCTLILLFHSTFL